MAKTDTVTIDILGTRLQLRSGDDPDSVIRAGNYVKVRVEELAERAPAASPIQLVLLTAINIADDLLKVGQTDKQELEAAIAKANQILNKVEEDM